MKVTAGTRTTRAKGEKVCERSEQHAGTRQARGLGRLSLRVSVSEGTTFLSWHGVPQSRFWFVLPLVHAPQ